MTDEDTNAMRPSEKRLAERRQQKQEGRARRADLLLKKQTEAKGRQDAIEGRQAQIEKRLAEVEKRLEAHDKRLQQLETSNP